MEISGGRRAGLPIRTMETAPHARRSGRLLDRSRPETILLRAGFASRIIQPPPPLLQEPPDEQKPIAPSTPQAVPKRAPRLIPRNGLDGPTVNLLNAPTNLLSLRLFGFRVNLDIEALAQRVDQSGASFLRKRQSVSKQFRRFDSHGSILLRTAALDLCEMRYNLQNGAAASC
jgi:hypothetical protein